MSTGVGQTGRQATQNATVLQQQLQGVEGVEEQQRFRPDPVSESDGDGAA